MKSQPFCVWVKHLSYHDRSLLWLYRSRRDRKYPIKHNQFNTFSELDWFFFLTIFCVELELVGGGGWGSVEQSSQGRTGRSERFVLTSWLIEAPLITIVRIGKLIPLSADINHDYWNYRTNHSSFWKLAIVSFAQLQICAVKIFKGNYLP